MESKLTEKDYLDMYNNLDLENNPPSMKDYLGMMNSLQIKSPAFQFYAQDFLTGCMFLKNDEVGMYIRMISKQWTDFLIPKKRLGLFLGVEWKDLPDELKEKYIDCGDYAINKRLEDVRSKNIVFINKQRENGKKGGRPSKDSKPKLNPNDSQKKPIEDRRVKNEEEEEIEIENKKAFESEKFKDSWNDWITYRLQLDNFKYVPKGEKAALTSLENLAKSDNEAIAIIQQSIANGWKGFFEIKQNLKTATDKPKNKSNRNRPTDDGTDNN